MNVYVVVGGSLKSSWIWRVNDSKVPPALSIPLYVERLLGPRDRNISAVEIKPAWSFGHDFTSVAILKTANFGSEAFCLLTGKKKEKKKEYILCDYNILVVRVGYLCAQKMEGVRRKGIMQMLFVMSMSQWIGNICNCPANFNAIVQICLKPRLNLVQVLDPCFLMCSALFQF